MEHVSLRASLRERTRAQHARLDAALTGPEGRVTDVPGYLRVLRTLHGLHTRSDSPLRSWAAASPYASSLDPELLPDRADLYAADLATLGETPTTQPYDDHVADARGLALLYLVAGSSAGARVLLRGLPDVVPTGARRGLNDAAGRSSTALWRDTVELLERPVDPRLGDAVVAEASSILDLLLGAQELVAS